MRVLGFLMVLVSIVAVPGCCGTVIQDVSFSPDSATVTYTKTDVFVPFWPIPLYDAAHYVCWEPVGLSKGGCSKMLVGRTGNLRCFLERKAKDESICYLLFSPDSRHVGARRTDGALIVIDVQSRRQWSLTEETEKFRRFTWYDADEIIYWAGEADTSKDAVNPIKVWKHNIHESSPSRMLMHPKVIRELMEARSVGNGRFCGFVESNEKEVVSPDGEFAARRVGHFPFGLFQTLSVHPTAEQ